jgi:alkanesulfonate monooxygenase SsuD/methylene tetrahydromethanopterin reductase-like flavin-dependent oxidoreductase (luciferase family)
MAGIEFGVFDWIDRNSTPLGELYNQRLNLLERADRAGYHRYHLAEHHATPLGMAPSPSVFLAAAARQTQRIRLGPLVYLLPLYEPLRLIEEICMLDHLSGGRFELGVGRGVSPYELGAFGVDPANTQSQFDEALEVLVQGLTSSHLNFAGEHYQYNNVPMALQPAQSPYPPLWYPTHNPTKIAYAARHGYHYVGLGPAFVLKEAVDEYRHQWQAHHADAGRLNAHVDKPLMGAMRQVFVADTDAEAEAMARSAHADWYRSITKLWHDHDDHSVDHLFSWDLGVQAGTILFGAPATVRGQVDKLLEESGCNYFIGSFAWGSLPMSASERSLELFAEHVMPHYAS